MLVTVEIVASVYYVALAGATRSLMLRAVCGRVAREEEVHVRFQSERLAILRRGRSRPGMALTRLLCRALFRDTCLAVWKNHGRAIRRGCLLPFQAYLRRCRGEFSAARRYGAHPVREPLTAVSVGVGRAVAFCGRDAPGPGVTIGIDEDRREEVRHRPPGLAGDRAL